MRVNYKGNKMRKEAARRQEQEAKRLRRLNKKDDSAPVAAPENPAAGTNPTGV